MAEKDLLQMNNTCSAENINPILCAECGAPMYSEKIDNLGDYTIASFCTKCGYAAIFTRTDENSLVKVGDITSAPVDAAKEILAVCGVKCINPGCDGTIEVKTRNMHYGATTIVKSSIVLQCTKCHSIFEIDNLINADKNSNTITTEEMSNENNLPH